MGLDVWFAEDIRNALLAANEASAATARVCAALGGCGRDESSTRLCLRAYREGYRAALATVALAFGIAPQTVTLRSPDSVQDTALQAEAHPGIHQPFQTSESGEEP